ncbi:hypothetical protein EDB80DRAFT_723684 [Ilyonectria destructans]|nr:hypothetical protein EDB80DRAFT_723684 [Ilyonectria destructans]
MIVSFASFASFTSFAWVHCKMTDSPGQLSAENSASFDLALPYLTHRLENWLDLRAVLDAVTAPRRRRDQLRAPTVTGATAQLVVGGFHGTAAGVAMILERLRSGGGRLHG